MAEETKDAAYWEKQWNQLKTELDSLNPQHDAAKAKIGELTAQNETLTLKLEQQTALVLKREEEVRALETIVATNKSAFDSTVSKLVDDANLLRADLEAAKVTITEQAATIAKHQAATKRLANLVGPVFSELSALLTE